MVSLRERLRGRSQPLGYVSFLSALVHHGALVDSLALIQVASPDRAGRDRSTTPGPILFLPIPRDLFFGWRVEPFEGTSAPVAGVEKALLDWVYWCEEHGLEARLDEIEWEVIDLDLLERLARETGVEYRASLFGLTAASGSSHDQDRLRADRWRARQLEDEAVPTIEKEPELAKVFGKGEETFR